MRCPDFFLETVDLPNVAGDLFTALMFSCSNKNTFAVFLSVEGRFLTVRPELAWLVAIFDDCSV